MDAANIKELTERAELAEFHAHSVRQLQARHERLLSAIDLLAARESPLAPGGLAAIAACIRNSPAEFNQDVFAAIVNGGKRDGFFVEFGACDGKLLSNTFTLEALGWRGILAEPLPTWHAALRRNRSCALDTRCIWSRSGKTVHLNEIAADAYATQATVTPGARATGAMHDVPTVSLDDLLREHNAPEIIDFLSIDAEGAEAEILSAFSFRQRFGFVAIETLHGDGAAIEQLMQAQGYRRILPEASGHDGFYVPA